MGGARRPDARPCRADGRGGRDGRMIDVLVVGGGPVGLATAIACTRAGLTVAVAEPRRAPIDKACGEGVMPAAVRRLAALGVTPDGHPLRGIRYLDGRHRADARFRHGDGLGVRRTVLHAALASRAAALGIAVLPVRVTSFERHPSHVCAAGVEARYLVAADGLHSTIRRCLERDGAAAGFPSVPAAGARGAVRRAAECLRAAESVRSRGAVPRRATGCAVTTGSRRGRTWSRCTGRRTPRRT